MLNMHASRALGFSLTNAIIAKLYDNDLLLQHLNSSHICSKMLRHWVSFSETIDRSMGSLDINNRRGHEEWTILVIYRKSLGCSREVTFFEFRPEA
jgi:hypothetical protein